jgi:glutamate/tyrosine decarboxylase-like PLP-dependent enzyme
MSRDRPVATFHGFALAQPIRADGGSRALTAARGCGAPSIASRAVATRRELIDHVLKGVEAWEARWGAMPGAPALTPDVDLPALLEDYAARMDAMFPFFHPRYAGQMLKPPHPVAVAAYLAAMIVNPNNHAIDASQATSPMEVDVMRSLAAMFGLPEQALGHLTTSGTVANLEALWVARELAPATAVVHSDAAHYTHGRMCRVLGVESRAVRAQPDGRIDLEAVAAELARGGVGTVVLTPGTAGVGAVDDIRAALELKDRYGVRLHVDAAYGGFFTLLGEHDAYDAIGRCDSVVVDPHKHGLQPYGCGAVLFADAAIGRLYKHDSPYTYFTSDELHLGEISLECSRAGAAAAALWLTLQAFPLERDRGLGAILRSCRNAALALADRLRASDTLQLHLEPALDIVTYWPRRARMSEIDVASAAMLHAGMAAADDQVFLSTLRVDAGAFAALHPDVERDVDSVRVLRSVLMKPEHEAWIQPLHDRLEALAGRSD